MKLYDHLVRHLRLRLDGHQPRRQSIRSTRPPYQHLPVVVLDALKLPEPPGISEGYPGNHSQNHSHKVCKFQMSHNSNFCTFTAQRF